MLALNKLIVALFLISIFSSTEALSAEIFFAQQPNSHNCRIEIEGTINSGDSEKLKNLVNNNLSNLLLTDFIVLNSNGGSVVDAIGIASIVEEAGFVAVVPTSSVCASACALIYMSSPFKFRLGKVLIHRPYFNLSGMSAADYDHYSKRQQEAMLLLRNYLSARAIPSGIVDKMMSLSSSSSYEITNQDDASMGYMSPMIEEIVLKKCEVSNSTVMSSNLVSTLECMHSHALQPMKGAYIARRYGNETLSKAINNLDERKEKGVLRCQP